MPYTAHMTYANPVCDPVWFCDSYATHYVIVDPLNFLVKTEFAWNEQLQVGNGTKIQISNIGMPSIFPTYNQDTQFILKNILHEPSITMIILNVSQFTKNNNICVEFNVDCMYIKDKGTCQRLMQRSLRNGFMHLT